MIQRVRISFATAPYLEMAAYPIYNSGVNVTELPGLASWMVRTFFCFTSFFRAQGLGVVYFGYCRREAFLKATRSCLSAWLLLSLDILVGLVTA